MLNVRPNVQITSKLIAKQREIEKLATMLEQTFFSRYLAGDHKNVWEELQAFGEIIDQPLKADALAVARETMRRVKVNLEVIVSHLKKAGFEFPDPDQVFVLAQSHSLKFLDAFEQRWGVLPFSVRAWYECIHSVNLFASKPISKDLIQSLDPALVAASFSSCTNLSDYLANSDKLRWYMQGINFLSLEESLTEVLEAAKKFQEAWEGGKVDDRTRNYYFQNKIDPAVLTVDFLPIGMAMSTCEPMGFEVGVAKADCVIADDDGKINLVDFLRAHLLSGELLHGHCARNQQYDYVYIGKMPDHCQVAAEVTKELLLF